MRRSQKSSGRPTKEKTPLLAQKIVEIATEMFVSCGYSATTMDDLARTAGVSKKTIYFRYKDKETLFKDVVEQIVRPDIREGLSARDSLPMDQGLRHRAELIIKGALEPRSMAFYRLVQSEITQFPELGRQFERMNHEQLYEPLTRYFADHSNMLSVEPAWAARLFIYLLFGDLNHRLLMATDAPTADEIEEYINRICRLILNGILTTAG